MKILPLSAAICLLLCAQPILAKDKESFNSVYKAFIQAQEAGETKQTLKFAKKALKLGKRKFSDDEESLTNLKYNLALALADDGQFDAAEKVYQEIRQAYKETFGEISQPYFLASLDLLDLYNKFGWPDEKRVSKDKRAAKLIKQVITITKDLDNEDERKSAGNYYLAAKAVFDSRTVRNNYKSVLKFADTARDKVLASFGENDNKSIEIRYLAGQLNMAKGQYKKAVKNLETIVSTVNSSMETSHPYELASHAVLIKAYEKLGKSDEATKHCIAIGQMTPWQENAEPTPLYRVNPRYPISAVKAGKEGFTKMSFDISTSGFVQNIKILDSSSESFAEESIAALDQWRYAPKFENGKAVAAKNLEVQLDYTIVSSRTTRYAL